MSRLETALTRWTVYCQIHTILPLDFRVFNPILERIRAHVVSFQSNKKSSLESQAEDFNAVADAFVSQCLTFIRCEH